MDNLSISLTERRARHTEWRVFAILAVSGLLFLLVLLVHVATSESLRVVNAVSNQEIDTVAFKNTLRAKNLSEQNAVTLQGMPYSLADLAQTNSKGVAFHYSNAGLVGFTVDRSDEAFLAKATNTGLFVQRAGRIVTISTVELAVHPKPRRVLFIRTLFADGLYKHSDNLSAVRVQNHAITIRHGHDPFIKSSVHLPANAEITSVSNSATSELIYGMGPYRLIQGTIHNEPFFHLTTSSSLDTQTLIQFGTELLARQSLSTQAWTSVDLYKRTRIEGTAPIPEISSDGDITIVSFTGTNINLYIVKTQEISTITTIIPTAELVSRQIENDCLRHAHSFITVDAKTIAESNRALRICF